jgi:hypothetical protein
MPEVCRARAGSARARRGGPGAAAGAAYRLYSYLILPSAISSRAIVR